MEIGLTMDGAMEKRLVLKRTLKCTYGSIILNYICGYARMLLKLSYITLFLLNKHLMILFQLIKMSKILYW
jgi:hypothetical protein